MKIDMPKILAVNNYKISNTASVNTVKAQSVSQKDVSSFSSDATLFSEVLKAAKADVNERINTQSPKLDTIKDSVNNSTYGVPTSNLVIDIILNN